MQSVGIVYSVATDISRERGIAVTLFHLSARKYLTAVKVTVFTHVCKFVQ